MGILDDEIIAQKLDKDKMLEKIQEIPEQVEIAWDQVQKFIIPTHYINAKNIVILGMGGSAIGGDLIKDLVYDTCKIPVSVIRDYTLPAYVNSQTLVIGSSYSGDTEETLATFSKAAEIGAKLIAITKGGKIGSICRKYKIPVFEVSYESQPRAAIAYSLIPLLGIFAKLGYIELEKDEINEMVKSLYEYKQKIDANVPTHQNEAKKMAEKLTGKLPTIIASGILKNVARRMKDQINENSKMMAAFDEAPELCHNHIVGLDYAKEIVHNDYTLLLQSKFDHPRNKLRYQVLVEILRKKGIEYEALMIPQKGGKISEMMHYILFVDYVSYYLAVINNVDPTPVDVIKFLKEKLAENK